eukprot:6193572-Pleurochrysis_carterae.AAC.2
MPVQAAAYGVSPSLWAELSGHCPVTLARGPKLGDYASRALALKEGKKEFCVEYESKRYVMASAECMEEFLATPWKFSRLTLPSKLLPASDPLDVGELPTRGYSEQTLGDSLKAALTDLLTLERPKYPTLSCTETALKFVALHLKVTLRPK